MDTTASENHTNALTEEQIRDWKQDGYLHLKGLLTSDEVRELTDVVDRMHAEHLNQPDAEPHHDFDQRNVMEEDDIFAAMMDHPATFSIVLELMGPYIGLGMSEVIVRPKNLNGKGRLHTDGGQAMRQIRVSEDSIPLQIKLQYFLTDVPGPNMGNFTLVPGSHRRLFPEGGFEEGPNIPEAVQMRAESGDVAIFTHSLWHGYAPNHSEIPRKSMIYCYVQQFLRPYDFERPSQELLERCTPRQRRLIGDIGEWHFGSYFYSPADQVDLMTDQPSG
ncbi:MAG: phytanoyl-CoA dioxygenase family protein [Candidatus Poribacteria bacterium]|nr:phytanoyl-CoA dioxygenase family protein [Candidatus Poribacteria bacterium]